MDENVVADDSGAQPLDTSDNVVVDSSQMTDQQILDQLGAINGNLEQLKVQGENSYITDQTMLEEFKGFASSAKTGEEQQVPEYSESLNDISKFLAYTDILLVVILVFMVLFMGIVGGRAITDWLRNRQ